jgi:DNA ligase-1
MELWAEDATPVHYIVFDLIYRDGEVLLDAPLSRRRELLVQLLSGERVDAVRLIDSRVVRSAQEIGEEFDKAMGRGSEGIMAKAPTSPYTPGRRGKQWLKLKRPPATLDVVVTAAEWGHGKRHKVLSDVTFAVRDGEELLNIGKAYSGLTDREIDELTAHFLEHTVADEGFRRIVEPDVVLEVAFDTIQKSDRHSSGYALRFPRILRRRWDKEAAQVDTLQQVEELYQRHTGSRRP